MMQGQISEKVSRLTTVICLFLVLVLLIRFLSSIAGFGGFDLEPIWLAVQLVLRGENPYDPSLLSAYDMLLSRRVSSVSVYYPPGSLLLLSAVLFPSLSIAKLVLLLFSCVVLLLAVRIVRFIPETPSSTSLWQILTVATFLPLWIHLWLGQLTTVALAGLLLLFMGLSRLEKENRRWSMGLYSAGLLLSCTKPHLFGPVYAFLLALSLRRREWTPALALAIAAGIYAALPLLVNPGLYKEYFSLSSGPSATSWHTPIIGTLLFQPIPSAKIWFWLLGTATLFAVVLKYGAGNSPARYMVRWVLPIGLLLAPYAWTYDFVILVPTIALVLAEQGLQSRLTLILLLAGNAGLLIDPINTFSHFWYPPFLVIVVLLKALRNGDAHSIARY